MDYRLAQIIDHTLLRPTAAGADIDNLCREAGEYGFWSVCVHPWWVRRAARSGVRVTTVIGFPLGMNETGVKVLEARLAVEQGAAELDVVINPVHALALQMSDLERELASVVESVPGCVVKAIIETGQLTPDMQIAAARAAVAAGVDFVKTCTGFGPGTADVNTVRRLRDAIGPGPGIKASGGIRTAESARELVASGAARLGTSAGVDMITDR